MDPLSITGAVSAIIGIVAVALHSTRRMIEFIDSIQGAPQAVKALLRDLNALENVLQTLNEILSHPDFQSNTRRAELATLLQGPLDNCTLALEDISLAIKPYIKTVGDSRKSKWRGFTWSFREKEIITLQRMLMSYKSSLNMAVAVANLSTTSVGFSDTKMQIRGLQQHLDEDSRSVADASYQGSEAIGSDPGYNLRRYLLQSDSNLNVFSEISSQQIYEMGSNFSTSPNRSDEGFREPAVQAQTSSISSPIATNSGTQQQRDQNAQDIEPPVLVTSQELDLALSKFRPSLSETIKLKAQGPTFGLNLGLLYQRDGVVVPRVVRYCMAVAEQVGRQTAKVYDLKANEDDVSYLKDSFDNGRPVQVKARAIFDQRTVDPRKLNFSKGDEILILEPKDANWFLGRRQDASGLLPTNFVQFSAEDIAGLIGTCKVFFKELPNNLIPKLQYDNLVKAAGRESTEDSHEPMKTTIHELPLPHFELLKEMMLHLHRVSVLHSNIATMAIDLAGSWAPILMGRNGSAVEENRQELHIRIIRTLITFAEEIFESDPTERYADPSFTSVALMPNIRPSLVSESEDSRTGSPFASAESFRSMWQYEVSSVTHIVATCTKIIESSDWKSQIYHTDALELEVKRTMSFLMSRLGLKPPQPTDRRRDAPSLLAVATLLKKLIATKPTPLIALDAKTFATRTSASDFFTHSSILSTIHGLQDQAGGLTSVPYNILKTIMVHLCRISEKQKNAFALARVWTSILTHKVGSPVELRHYQNFIQETIMKAHEVFEEPRPEVELFPIYELE